ncbi:adenosylmethionine decarboxylase [Emcibacter sp. SYSU 3D8]|uniref:adenosylmethionine decarboxylase n=1 Tax=Emcibacter sp. SYSU 3D8 TaxID=3133969 RepID=UPI0031FF0B34
MSQTQSLFQLGMDLYDGSTNAQTEEKDTAAATAAPEEENRDHFVERDGVVCAGIHLVLDLIGARRLDDLTHIDQTLRRCIEVAGATLLHIHLHYFTPNGGVSGVAVLAESHISIHTWPERDYAALDIFMCGDADPHAAIEVLREAFEADEVEVHELLRGTAAA